MPLRRRPDTPISAESSFSSPSLSRHPPPASPPFSSAEASREPVTPPEEQEDEDEEEEKPEDPPSTTPTELSAFFASITAFLERDYLDEKTLTLTEVSPARLAKFQRWALNRRLHRLRYTYDAATGTLHLRGMITTVHSAINPWLTEIYSKIPLSDEERSHIILDTSYDIQLRGGVIWQPDAAFNYIFFDEEEGEEVTDLYPRVIFEVAFAQKHAAVKRRAEGWLKGAKGMVKVVVAVNIEEGRRPGAVGDSGAADRDDSRGENQEGESAGSETESDDFTSEQAIADFYKSCKTSDLVGPLTATVELFRLGKDGDMERDGPVYRFLPDRSPDADPVLRISDLLRDTRDDDQRTVTLPLQRYGQLINTAKRRLALIRKTRQKKSKRKRVEEEGEEGEDYVTVEVPERQVKRGRLLRSGSGIIGGEGPSGDVRG